MPYAHYDRLTALDDVFLEIENDAVHMHVGAVALFETEPLRDGAGHLDIERIRAFTASAMQDLPRFRQRLAWVPLVGQPVWIDDARFNLQYHVRHTALPPPGDVRQLKRLAGRVFSQKLDRSKPMWEMWVVEGVEEDRFALIAKVHHCMVDGIAGMDLLAALLRLAPETEIQPAKPWIPRPAPDAQRLLREEVLRRAWFVPDAIGAARRAIGDVRGSIDAARETALGVYETVSAGLAPTTDTPLNPQIGPYRRFDWVRMDLDAVREIRRRLGGTLNDVVLTTVAGAVGRFLASRGAAADADTVFRTMVPVSVRDRSERGRPGNRVVNFLAQLPVHVQDPVERLARTREVMARLKSSRVVSGSEILEEFADRTFTSILVEFVRLAANTRAYNLVVTNVPGPRVPLYLLGARMSEIFPLVPLFVNQGLGIALFSYDGQLCWGFCADWDALPDLHDFTLGVEAEFESLRAAAEKAPEPVEPPARSARRRREASRKARETRA